MVETWEVALPQDVGTGGKRKVYCYLPESYEAGEQRYPVLYMFDGHNVFFDSDATFGKSWGMLEYLEREKTDIIVVAVSCDPCGNGRLEEYAPFDFEIPGLGTIRGRGKSYLDWLTGSFKNEIDSRYRTLPDRGHTLLAGSSMGGLMALYGAVGYSSVFQRAAALSPSLWIAPEKSHKMLASGTKLEDSCVYMDYGSEEMGNHPGNPEILLDAAKRLIEQGVKLTFRIVPGGKHCEASWEKQIPIFMKCLGF